MVWWNIEEMGIERNTNSFVMGIVSLIIKVEGERKVVLPARAASPVCTFVESVGQRQTTGRKPGDLIITTCMRGQIVCLCGLGWAV